MDPRFATNVARVNNRVESDKLVASGFARFTASEALAQLAAADIAFASVNDMAGLSSHPHLRRIEVETQSGRVAFPAPAPIFKGTTRQYRPVPGIGQHAPIDRTPKEASQ